MKPSIPGLPRGGARPGAGRPKKNVSAPASPRDQTPLLFLLATMRDPNIDLRLRIAAAKAALPYCGKKVVEDVVAPDAVDRDSWANILKFKK
jgi:hypothetical protein